MIMLTSTLSLFAQQKVDKANFINPENKFYQDIQKSIELFNAGQTASREQVLEMDFSSRDLPKAVSEFKTVWASDPVSQGATNTCWCFSKIGRAHV